MQCETFEFQLHAILDERRGADADAALERHASHCPTCHQLLADYTVLLDTVSARAEVARTEVTAPRDLADQVLADLPRLPTSRLRRLLSSNLRLASALAVAASLLIAAYLWSDYRQDMANRSSVKAEVQRIEALLPLLGVLDEHGIETVCRATGRSLATLPTTFPTAVRQVTSDSPSDPLLAAQTGWTRSVASGIRPLAVSMVWALDALRSTLPSKSDSPIDTDPASTETS